MKQIRQLILEKLNYRIVGKEYARLGGMVKRYGKFSVIAAIEEISKWSFKIDDLMDILEKQSQKHIKRDRNSEVSKRIDKVIE